MNRPLILVSGANGTIGCHLVPRLLEAGYRVRAMVRQAGSLASFPWRDQVEVCEADVLRPDTLTPALHGIEVAYYLVHSMMGGTGFESRDRQAAQNFGDAAREAGVSRIIYLGALGDSQQKEFSSHLRSRQETAQVLRETGVPVTEFRAGIIIGQGSLSFEMIRALTERIPLMVCPRWVFQRTQPIAMDDVMNYLVQALDTPESTGQIVEIGGEHVLTYGELMLGYARERGLKRFLIPVPVLTPRLSSYWVHWTTPIAAAMAKPLIEGLRSEVVVRDQSASRLFPEISCRDYATAVQEVLARLRPEAYESVMTKAPKSPGGVGARFEQGMIVEVCQAHVNANAEAVYQAFCHLGAKGWGLWQWAWWLRAQIDRCLGGIGFRRSRPEGRPLEVNDHLDFFRVDHVVPDKVLRLEVDMKLPGRGWLEFRSRTVTSKTTQLVLTVYYAPRGLWGLVYWYGLHPIHRLIFASLLRQLQRDAESRTEAAARTSV